VGRALIRRWILVIVTNHLECIEIHIQRFVLLHTCQAKAGTCFTRVLKTAMLSTQAEPEPEVLYAGQLHSQHWSGLVAPLSDVFWPGQVWQAHMFDWMLLEGSPLLQVPTGRHYVTVHYITLHYMLH
jgi:hypothetical protein